MLSVTYCDSLYFCFSSLFSFLQAMCNSKNNPVYTGLFFEFKLFFQFLYIGILDLASFSSGSRGLVFVVAYEIIADLEPFFLRYIHVNDGIELFSDEKRLDETILTSEIIEICILDDALEYIVYLGEENRRQNESLYLLYARFCIPYLLQISTGYLHPDALVIGILDRETGIMKKRGDEEIRPVFSCDSLLISQVPYPGIYIESMIDIVIRIVINRFEKIDDVPQNIVDYFLFIHCFGGDKICIFYTG